MRAKGLLLAAGLGCTLGYFFDSRAGRRRRAMARDKFARARRTADNVAGRTLRDLRNRAQGLLAGTGSGLLPYEVPDEILHDQIRSRLGRVVSHPGAIEVDVRNGRVNLYGPILDEEVGPLLAELSSLRGILDLTDTLEVHGGREVRPSPQGAGSPERIRPWKRDTWPPAFRLAAGSAGALLLASARKGKVAKGALAGAGTALLLRSAFNMPWSRIVGVGAGRTAVDVRKSIHVDAPVEEVFELWSNFENMPNFFSNVKDVRRTDRPGEYCFTVSGPGGIPVEWNARVTRIVPNEQVGWKTVSDSLVKNAGEVEFRRENGGTRVDVHLKYNPGMGALGHAAAKLFGADPKTLMDEDLGRMKAYLESGRRSPFSGN